ncbi:MAG: SdpI family protein [Oscillospiraceae bacterium]|nr:SdpI family protein [Oscillospiraceae bacterium]
MIKKYWKQLLISSLIILLPIAVGLILWNALPDRFATHWGLDSQADGWSGKAFAIFATPLTMLALHWFCMFFTMLDPNGKKQSKKIFNLVFWMVPILSVVSSGMIYALALDTEFSVTSVMLPGMAILFILLGNYMPKCKQNYTIGIKVVWALANEENWNATHRFAGKLWVGCGIALLLFAFLPADFAMAPMFILITVMAVAPVIYSWRYYKKQNKNGPVYEVHPSPMGKATRAFTIGTVIFVAVILVFVVIMLFTGDLDYIYEADSFTVDPSNWNSITVDYDEITAIELRHENVPGSREWGLGSFRLLLGTFKNEEFGLYTRYTYYNPEACVVVTCGEKVLVLSGSDAERTQRIYDILITKWEGE